MKRKSSRFDNLSPKVPDSERLKRLSELGAEKLSTMLVELARSNSDVDDTIERLIASPKKNVVRFKEKLANLSCMDHFIEWRERDLFVHELESLLADLKVGITDPREGVELLISFFESDQAIFRRCDDDGTIGNVFLQDARQLLAHFAEGCADKDWILDRLLYLYVNDQYCVRVSLFDNAVDFLPVESIDKLLDALWKLVQKEPLDSYRWTMAIASLARQLRDPQLLQKVRLVSEPNLSSKSMVEIAQLSLESGDANSALDWLEKVPEKDRLRIFDYDELSLKVFKKLKDKKSQTAVAWRVFKEHRSKDTLDTLLSVIGKSQKKAVIEAQAKEILCSMTLSFTDAEFLVDCGLIDEAENYILRDAGQIDGADYGSILPLAEAMEKHRRYFSATVLYRALLDAILNRAYSRAYHHGVEYLEKLDEFAKKITRWQDLLPHHAYVQQLRRSHSRKISFWSQYEL